MYRTRFPAVDIAQGARLGSNVTIERGGVQIGASVLADFTQFANNARVFGGRFGGTSDFPSRVAGETVVGDHPSVLSSVLCCDSVHGTPLLVRAGIFGSARVFGSAVIQEVEVRDSAYVYGSAVLDGRGGSFIVSGHTRICAGYWRRAPRVASLGWVESLERELWLTEGPPGYAMVGCTLESYDRWFRVGPRWGRRCYGLSAEQTRVALDVLDGWLRSSL